MTAYIDRVRRLASDQPSLRVRPRSRFEPALPDSEPPWERALPDAALWPFETDIEPAARPARPQRDVPPAADTAGRRPAPAVPARPVPARPAPADSEPPWERALADAALWPFETDIEPAARRARPQRDVPPAADTAGRRPAPAVPARPAPARPAPADSEPPWERALADAALWPFETDIEPAARRARPQRDVPPAADTAGRRPAPAVPARPVPADSEPPLERALPDAAVSPFETDIEPAAHPARPQRDVPPAADTAGRRPAPEIPANDHPDTGTARPWSGLRPVDARRREHASGGLPRVPEEPPTTIRSLSPARPVAADHAVASSQARPARPAVSGDPSDRDEHRSAPPEELRAQSGPADRAPGSPGHVPAPASSRSESTGSTRGDRSGTGTALAVPATRGGRFEASQGLNGQAGPNDPAMGGVPAVARPRRRDPAEAAGPSRGSFPPRADRSGRTELESDDRPTASLARRPAVERLAAAEARSDEVTVTIGRVEVRVGPPPPPAGAAAVAGGARSARPRPSRLDDYLRARASGRVG